MAIIAWAYLLLLQNGILRLLAVSFRLVKFILRHYLTSHLYLGHSINLCHLDSLVLVMTVLYLNLVSSTFYRHIATLFRCICSTFVHISSDTRKHSFY